MLSNFDVPQHETNTKLLSYVMEKKKYLVIYHQPSQSKKINLLKVMNHIFIKKIKNKKIQPSQSNFPYNLGKFLA